MSRGSTGGGFFRARGGNVAILTALSLLPILAVVGFAVDMSRARNANLHTQDALDAAVLSAAKLMQTDGETADVDKQVADMFVADMTQLGVDTSCDKPVVSKSVSAKTLEATVSCDLETRIMPIFGRDDVKFTRYSKAAYSINKLEVAFMFDVSGSMAGQKLVDLKSAAGKGLDVLFDLPVAAAGDMRVAMSTFSTSVNAGMYFHAATNLDNPRTGWHRNTPSNPASAVSVVTSATCVTERTGSEAFTDAAPGDGAWVRAQNDVCPVSSILPLTAKRSDIDTAINGLVANGQTAGHLGIAWTWYLLSPEWASIWPSTATPKAYDTPDLTKVAILMTDGEFNTAYESGNGDVSSQALSLCGAMKGDGVQVFAITFQAPSAAKTLMTKCASGGSFYAAENATELEAAYKSIAVRISKLRIAS
ncbi:MAG: Tad domain-containing protein [Alphaproteobacteria bacterium]